MTTAPRHETDGLRYTVALIEIQGGLVGLWGFLQDLSATAFKMPLVLVPGVAVIGLVLVASVVAGVALWQDRRLGYALSVPVQLVQVAWFVGASLTFRISASGWLLADLFLRSTPEAGTTVGWQLDVARKGGYALSLAPREETTFALNLVALAILIWLALRLRTRPPEPRHG
ncbi:hypothetical protein [Methylobacterium haplocladii]|uniref:Uncharacterized protein n=1 Tax=Methylobacterium haplocladii TaxID=1176176 RepID=A0A512ILJ2_9HYPH|nr:hypothetical protein [Methylobacterium haplocladii]GEO98590.1 hypothetical protein MHA02_09780 [Methylobacterium haplocladii]GJD84010.1 hypothetical protein HPGCJGGD_1885 [Methylobacterium haplocladii]GLS59232.1 hypothetical protein GCM10007887_18980 [Methylobacterium haplocladii]